MISVRHGVGKLWLVFFRRPVDQNDITSFTLNVRAATTAASDKVMFCSDMRQIDLFDKDEYDTIVWLMRRDNPKLLAASFLVKPTNAALKDQMVRMVEEGRHPRRRVFSSAEDLVAWASPMLTAEEQLCLEAHVG
jgi:hypothetical protein